MLSDPSGARSTTRRARCSAPAASGGSATPGGAGGPGGATFDFGDLFGGGGRRRRARRRARRPVRPARRRPAPAAPRRGADVESEVTLPFDEAVEGVTVPLRMTSEQPCPTCHGTGGQGGTLPHTCPTCHGTGQTSRNAGGFAFAEPCRECRGRGHGRRRPVPRLPRQRPGAGHPDAHRAHPGRRARTASASGSRARAHPASAAARPATCTSSSHVAPHRCSAASGDNLTLTVPVTLRRGGARRRDQGADPRRGAGDAARSRRAPPNGRTFRVTGKGAPRNATAPRATCSSPSRSTCPSKLSTARPGGRRGLARRHRRRRPAGRAARPRRGRLRCRSPRPRRRLAERRHTPVFVISVAAELTGLHAQTLRQYDRLGLVSPGRTPGGGRRYSRRDIAVLREVARLSGLGPRPGGRPAGARAREPGGRAAGRGSPSSRPSSTPFAAARPTYRPRRLAPQPPPDHAR